MFQNILMYCRNELERTQHPELSLIPYQIWRGEFEHHIPDFTLKLMSFDIQKLLEQLDNFKVHSKPLSTADRYKSLLALRLKNHDLNHDELLLIAQKMNTQVNELLQIIACLGDTAFFKKIIELCTVEKIIEIIRKEEYWPFCLAARYGHLQLMEEMIQLMPHDLQKMLSARHHRPFSLAASNGHLIVMEKILSLSSLTLDDILSESSHAAFRFAAKYGQLAIMQWFKKTRQDKFKKTIRYDDYIAFRYAVEHNEPEVVNWLINELNENEINDMLSSNNYEAWRMAAYHKHHAIIEILLSHQCIFVYAAQNPLYNTWVKHFIDERLNKIKERKQAFELSNADAQFDLSNHEDKFIYFYIIKNLIERNNEQSNQYIRMLLEIPAIASIAHINVNSEQENELFHLAHYIENQDALALLLTIPNVRMLVEAQAHESSLIELTQTEQKRLNRAIQYYQPQLERIGVQNIINKLCTWLIKRYQQDPATININEQKLSLPSDWTSFNSLNLTESQKQEALKAYYQHQDHSAWRYLQKPNPWIHEQASFIYVDEEDPTRRWSSFENIQKLIALFWLAATDTEISATEEHTLRGREDHFVNELALIGRAHNWDNTRINADGKSEEYDDLEADKPSCLYGVKRRLFQSVIGHPLLKILKKDDILYEIKQFVRTQFISKLKQLDKPLFLNSLMHYLIELNDTVPPILLDLNISLEQIQAFKNYMQEKYEAQLSTEPSFNEEIDRQLRINANGDPIEQSHALRFASMVNLTELVNKAESSSIRQLGLFAEAQSSEAPIEIRNNLNHSTG